MSNHHILPLELALTRWSVVHVIWSESVCGGIPILSAFLAGWMCRCIGADRPKDVGEFEESFNAGWREADCQIEIENNKKTRIKIKLI